MSALRIHAEPWRVAPYLSGLAAVVVLVWATLSSIGGFSGYSPSLHFISQLADPFNPRAGRVNTGFIVGGALGATSLVMLAIRAQPGSARHAATLGALACIGTAGVGAFPLTRAVTHFGFAVVTGACAFAACALLAIALRRAARQRPGMRIAAVIVSAAIGVFVAGAIIAAVHLVWVIGHSHPGSLSDLLRLPPSAVRVRLTAGGPTINPFAVLEWFFFSAVLSMFVAVCARGMLTAHRGRDD